MPDMEDINRRLAEVTKAFDEDGFDVAAETRTKNGPERIGLRAEHRNAVDGKGKRKCAYYVEGTPKDMGYLMGRLAESEIQRMSEDYIENYIRKIVPVAAPEKWRSKDWPLYEWLVNRVNGLAPPDPENEALRSRNEEIEAMVRGCHEANAATEVTVERLWALNLGVDLLFGLLYQGVLTMALALAFKSPVKELPPSGCSALAVLNDAASDGALFARDFMFPACNIFQDCASPVIYNPLPHEPDGPLPLIAMTAPGFVGSISAMNVHGVAAGVDVVHGGHNDPEHLGANSLLLVRHAIEMGRTIEQAADCICRTPRGVSWLYPMAADGGGAGDRACVVEASATPRDKLGNKKEELDFLAFPRRYLVGRKLLPTRAFVQEKTSAESPYERGAMVRWESYRDPCGERGYGDFNESLWRHVGEWRRKLDWKKVRNQFGEAGMIGEKHIQRRCPSGSYFAPLRTEPGQIVLATNHYVCPEMRLTAMGPQSTKLDRTYASDSQWRYDELNRLVREALGYNRRGDAGKPSLVPISEETVKRVIDFLEPECTNDRCPYVLPGLCFHYKKYHTRACRRRWATKQKGLEPIAIEGAISVFNLKARTMDSYYGYYGDPWVKLRLTSYVHSPLSES